jgi:hypothetical protein
LRGVLLENSHLLIARRNLLRNFCEGEGGEGDKVLSELVNSLEVSLIVEDVLFVETLLMECCCALSFWKWLQRKEVPGGKLLIREAVRRIACNIALLNCGRARAGLQKGVWSLP